MRLLNDKKDIYSLPSLSRKTWRRFMIFLIGKNKNAVSQMINEILAKFQENLLTFSLLAWFSSLIDCVRSLCVKYLSIVYVGPVFPFKSQNYMLCIKNNFFPQNKIFIHWNFFFFPRTSFSGNNTSRQIIDFQNNKI